MSRLSRLGTKIFAASKSMEAVDRLHLHHLGKTISYFIGPRHGNANVAQFFFPTLIESRNRVFYEQDTKISFTGFVDRGSGTIGKVTTREYQRRKLLLA